MYIHDNRSLRQIVKITFVILLLLAVYFRWVNHGWENIVQSDGRGYYAYLPSILTHQDLSFGHYLDSTQFKEEYKNNFLYIIDGRYVIKYPAGVAVMLTPFYLVADLITRAAGFEPSGYSFFYMVFVSLGAITYALIGLYCCIQLMAAIKVSPTFIVLLSFGVIFGTNLTNYIVREPSMSHVYSFAAVGFFLLVSKLFIDFGHRKYLLWMALSFGLILLIRPVNGIALLAVLLLINSTEEWKRVWMFLKTNVVGLLMAIFLFLVIISIQPILWYLQNGHWYVWTYLDEYFTWENPEIFKVLFSYRKGWLVYTPFFILVPISLVYLLAKGQIVRLLKTTLVWSVIVYVISSWWCWYYGGSFGQRAFIEFYPIAIISILPLLQNGFLQTRPQILKMFTGCCIFLNLVQSYQYKKNILHYDSMNKSKYWQVFIRTDAKYEWLFFKNPNSLPNEQLGGPLVFTCFSDFEDMHDKSGWMPIFSDISDVSLSGNHVASFGNNSPYGPIYKGPLELKENSAVYIRGFLYSSVDYSNEGVELTIALDDSTGQSYFKKTISVNSILSLTEDSDWKKFECSVSLPVSQSKSILVVYLYSPDNRVLLDDLGMFIFKPK